MIQIRWQRGAVVIVDRVAIGRADDNDIVVSEPDVSVYHCVIAQQDGDLFLHDLHSTNGTYANGQRVYRHTRLQPGDQVVIGSRLFLVECG
jgi:pSer/pThr/pTyr-binding forkhead associated (FHA) protein